jgi:hypothetical protein
VNGIKLSWTVNFELVMAMVPASLAERLKVGSLDEPINMSLAESDSGGAVGIIPRVRIGRASVANVPVLVLSDAQARKLNHGRIGPALGLMPLDLFGRVAWLKRGSLLELGDATPRGTANTPLLNGSAAPFPVLAGRPESPSAPLGHKEDGLDPGTSMDRIRQFETLILDFRQMRTYGRLKKPVRHR